MEERVELQRKNNHERSLEMAEEFESRVDAHDSSMDDYQLVATFETKFIVRFNNITSSTTHSSRLNDDNCAVITLRKSDYQTSNSIDRNIYTMRLSKMRGSTMDIEVTERSRATEGNRGDPVIHTVTEHFELWKANVYGTGASQRRGDLVIASMMQLGAVVWRELVIENVDVRTMTTKYDSANRLHLDHFYREVTADKFRIKIKWGVYVQHNKPYKIATPIMVDRALKFPAGILRCDAPTRGDRASQWKKMLRWHLDMRTDDLGQRDPPRGYTPPQFSSNVRLYSHQKRFVKWAYNVERDYLERSPEPPTWPYDDEECIDHFIPGIILFHGKGPLKDFMALRLLNEQTQTYERMLIFKRTDQQRVAQMMHLRSLKRLLPPLKGGLLGDEMGLGKTVSILGLIACTQEPRTGSRFIRGPDPHLEWRIPVSATLVVVPSHLVDHWKHQAEKIAPELRVMVLDSANAMTGSVLSDVIESDIVITTNTFIRRAWCKNSTFNVKEMQEPTTNERYLRLSMQSDATNNGTYILRTKEGIGESAARGYRADHRNVLGTGVGKHSSPMIGVHTSSASSVRKAALDTHEIRLNFSLFNHWMTFDPALVSLPHSSKLKIYSDDRKNLFPHPLLFHWKRVVVDEIQKFVDTRETSWAAGLFSCDLDWLQAVSCETRWYMSGSEPWYHSHVALTQLLASWMPTGGKYATLPIDPSYYGSLIHRHIWRHTKDDLQELEIVVAREQQEETTTDDGVLEARSVMVHDYGKNKKRARDPTSSSSASSPPPAKRAKSSDEEDDDDRRPLPPLEYLKIPVKFSEVERAIYDTMQSHSNMWGNATARRNAMLCSYIHGAIKLLESYDSGGGITRARQTLTEIKKDIDNRGRNTTATQEHDIAEISSTVTRQLQEEASRLTIQVEQHRRELADILKSIEAYVPEKGVKKDDDEYARFLDTEKKRLERVEKHHTELLADVNKSLDVFNVMKGNDDSAAAAAATSTAAVQLTKETLEQGCSICMEPFDIDSDAERPVIVMPCMHVFGSQCIMSWYNTGHPTCPVCRGDIHKDQFYTVPRESSLAEKTVSQLQRIINRFGSKMTRVVLELSRILDADPKHKVIIFSAWSEMLRQIYVLLKHKVKLNAALCLGDRRTKMRAVNRFATGDTRVVLLPIESMAEGLDLSGASHIMFPDKSAAPEAMLQREQAEARGHRMGQLHDRVYIIDFIVLDSIEERIYKQIMRFHRRRIKEMKAKKKKKKEGGRVLPSWMKKKSGPVYSDWLARVHANDDDDESDDERPTLTVSDMVEERERVHAEVQRRRADPMEMEVLGIHDQEELEEYDEEITVIDDDDYDMFAERRPYSSRFVDDFIEDIEEWNSDDDYVESDNSSGSDNDDGSATERQPAARGFSFG